MARNRQEILDLLDKIFMTAVDTAKTEGELKPERIIGCFRDVRGFINCFGGFLYFLNLGSDDPVFLAWLASKVKIEDIVASLQVEDVLKLLFGQPPVDSPGNRIVAGRLLEEMIGSRALDDESGVSELKVVMAWGSEVFDQLDEEHPTVAAHAREIIDLIEPGANSNLDLANAKAVSFFQKHPLKMLATLLPVADLLKPIRLFLVMVAWAYDESGQNRNALPPPIEPEPLEAEPLPEDDNEAPELELSDEPDDGSEV